MKMTVVIADEAGAVHVGSPVDYRCVTLDLTEAQAEALALRPYERYGPVVFEATAPQPEKKEGTTPREDSDGR